MGAPGLVCSVQDHVQTKLRSPDHWLLHVNIYGSEIVERDFPSAKPTGSFQREITKTPSPWIILHTVKQTRPQSWWETPGNTQHGAHTHSALCGCLSTSRNRFGANLTPSFLLIHRDPPTSRWVLSHKVLTFTSVYTGQFCNPPRSGDVKQGKKDNKVKWVLTKWCGPLWATLLGQNLLGYTGYKVYQP